MFIAFLTHRPSPVVRPTALSCRLILFSCIGLKYIFAPVNRKPAMQTYRSSLLPLFAFIVTVIALIHSCSDSKAENASGNSVSAELKQEVSRFETELNELKTIQQEHIKTYGDEMGCVRDSKALEIVNKHNALIQENSERL